MHVARTDGPDEPLARLFPDGEHHEYIAPDSVLPDSIETGFPVLWAAIGKNEGIASRRMFDFRL
jgi:hypothetical protein